MGSVSSFYISTHKPCRLIIRCNYPHNLDCIRSSPSSISIQMSTPSSSTNEKNNFEEFQKSLNSMSLPSAMQDDLLQDIKEMGFYSSTELYLLSKDFVDRPEVLGNLLKNDFGLNPVKSNLMRGVLMKLVAAIEQGDKHDSANGKMVETTTRNGTSKKIVVDTTNTVETNTNNGESKTSTADSNEKDSLLKEGFININGVGSLDASSTIGKKSRTIIPSQVEKKPLFKSVVVNQNAKQRHTLTKNRHNYGLPPNYGKLYPNLATELDNFLNFMTMTSASVQESPIRQTTAIVYIRHAKLFLGWYRTSIGLEDGNDSITINDIFPDKEAISAQPIIDFILWLRRTRQISDSYEANMLRGLTKLLKYRYRNESTADPSYGEKSFGDIPVVRELRKLHRDANRRQILSPRSSEEDRKWLDWGEYLNVVRLLKEDVEKEIQDYEEKANINKGKSKASPSLGDTTFTPAQRRIATKFQAYLILSFFSCVPDRQRTFRELELDRSFLRNTKMNCWTIKHGPDDYKTGKTYGDRPPLVLSPELTPAIDDFLERWRPCLKPIGNHFFVQPRTGKAFTQDTVYNLVARSCFKHTGKKTNPHLLRDMIVTHVRDSDASEKELEALALYMGHSIAMQRSSYDRRTMEQKVAPAVELLRNVNTSGS